MVSFGAADREKRRALSSSRRSQTRSFKNYYFYASTFYSNMSRSGDSFTPSAQVAAHYVFKIHCKTSPTVTFSQRRILVHDVRPPRRDFLAFSPEINTLPRPPHHGDRLPVGRDATE